MIQRGCCIQLPCNLSYEKDMHMVLTIYYKAVTHVQRGIHLTWTQDASWHTVDNECRHRAL